MPVPSLRVRRLNGAPLAPAGDYVLYWMVAARRLSHNFALQRAVELATELGKPVLVFEPLRAGYPWASDRLHGFVLDGMAANAARCASVGVTYFPYLEPLPGAGKGLLRAFAARACAVVTDDFPAFFLPRMLAAAGREVPVQLEAIDGNGLLPLRATEQVALTAYAFRRLLQHELPRHLAEVPRDDSLAGAPPGPAQLPAGLAARWPAVDASDLANGKVSLAKLPIDHSVPRVARRGGAPAAEAQLKLFLEERLERYPTDRSEPEGRAVSELSAYLHFGQLSVHAVLAALGRRFDWSRAKLGAVRSGKREGFWNVSPAADAFLDELVTWRELGLNFASHRDDQTSYDSLPHWALATLEKHAADPRPHLYSRAQLEAAETHDQLWNAAQRQMVREGYMHNYLRMLWGKKVLEWSRTPREAAETLLALNDKYELDGRDPNSYSGIFWIFGRYDRPWGPERPIFGLIRYMSSENTARKHDVKGYLARHAPQGELF